jgi:hypothetical protein
MRRRDGRIPENGSAFDCDVRDAQVVAELVPSGELVKVAVEIGIARTKRGSIVVLTKRPDLERGPGRAIFARWGVRHGAGCAEPGMACPSRSASKPRPIAFRLRGTQIGWLEWVGK